MLMELLSVNHPPSRNSCRAQTFTRLIIMLDISSASDLPFSSSDEHIVDHKRQHNLLRHSGGDSARNYAFEDKNDSLIPWGWVPQ